MAIKVKLFIQPVYSYSSGSIACAEVLIRGYKEMSNPMEILQYVEDKRIYEKFDLEVLEETLHIMSSVEVGCPVSVNICANTIEKKDIANKIISKIAEFNIDTHNIIIEINENTAFDNEVVKKNLRDLHNSGVKLALDDFGTGRTTLLSFVENKFDIVKIDKKFIEDDNWEVKKVILDALMKLSDQLEFATIVEGVETETRLSELKSMGISNVQGYVYSKPVSIEEFTKGE